MTKWEAIKHYINSKPIGTVITRQVLLFDLNDKSKTFCTVDSYKGILLRIGILECCGVGKYTILSHIRPDVSANEAKKAAYPISWRSWFNDFKLLE